MLEVQAVPFTKLGKNQRNCLFNFLILTRPAARLALVFLSGHSGKQKVIVFVYSSAVNTFGSRELAQVLEGQGMARVLST